MEGRRLADRYQLQALLGRGGMGSVWRARHLELGIDVAVKLMDPSLAELPNGLARFRREAQAAASLKSPNVVQVFDYGIDDGTPYIVMELLQGESLGQRIVRNGRLSLHETATVLAQVARAVGKAHEAGIVHRDLKPENIFLVYDEELEIAKVLDFGIAKQACPNDLSTEGLKTRTGVLLGSPYYMSPEQAAGMRDVDYRTDIWSFGIIAYECLLGRRVFNHDNIGALVLAICTEPLVIPSQVGEVPAGFDAWFSRCVARNRFDRFPSIREASYAFSAIDPLLATSPRSESIPALLVQAITTPRESTRGASQTDASPTTITVTRLHRVTRSRLLWSGLGACAMLLAALAARTGIRRIFVATSASPPAQGQARHLGAPPNVTEPRTLACDAPEIKTGATTASSSTADPTTPRVKLRPPRMPAGSVRQAPAQDQPKPVDLAF